MLASIAFINRKRNFKATAQQPFDSPRIGEVKGLYASQLGLAPNYEQASLCYSRYNLERVNARALRAMAKLEQSAKGPVLNSVAVHENVADKAQAFRLWREHGFDVPHFQVHNFWRMGLANQAAEFIHQHDGAFVRTSNEDSAKGLVYLPTPQGVTNVVNKLRLRAVFNKVSGSRLLCVQPIRNADGSPPAVHRVHVVGNQVICGYSLSASGKSIIHAKDITLKDKDGFVSANAQLSDWLGSEANQKHIVRALSVLGLQVGAVEFFLLNGRCVLLEVNPKWGGLHRFGDQAFNQWLVDEVDTLDLPRIKLWLQPEAFYTKFYTAIAQEFLEKESSA